MKERIIEIAKKNKVSEIGFCRMADYFEKESLQCKDRGVFIKNTPLNFDAKTAIVFAFSYYVKGAGGNISRYAWGKDYHIVAKEIMKPVEDLLKSEGYAAESYADVGPLNERMLARLSGIAFIGKNRMAINKRLGSYFFIGYILTDCNIEPDRENAESCANCGKCIAACPLGAITEGSFNPNKCISYISQKKGELSGVEIDALIRTETIWGCDICQEVCPHNTNIPETEICEFKDNIIKDLHIEQMSNRDFKDKFGERAFAWRGKNVLLRNQEYVYIIGSGKNKK